MTDVKRQQKSKELWDPHWRSTVPIVDTETQYLRIEVKHAVPWMDLLRDVNKVSNSLWMRSSMAALTGSQFTMMQSTFSWLMGRRMEEQKDGGGEHWRKTSLTHKTGLWSTIILLLYIEKECAFFSHHVNICPATPCCSVTQCSKNRRLTSSKRNALWPRTAV